MAWEDVPAKLASYDAEEYADNSNGTTASFKLLASFEAATVDDVPVDARDEFESVLDARLGACVNLRTSKGWRRDKLNRV